MCDTYMTNPTFRFYLIDFQLNTDFTSQFFFFFFFFFLWKKHLALVKDRFVDKMLLKRAKTRRLIFVKL